MGPLGWTEMVVIFFVALVVLGPKKLPELGKTLGKGLREFKRHSDELKSTWQEQLREVETPVHEIKQTFEQAQAEVGAPLHEVKQTFEQAQAEVEEVSAKIAEEEPPNSFPEDAPATASEETKETKPDGN